MSLLPMNGQGSYQSAAARIARQRLMAEQLRKQSMEQPQGEMIGGGGPDAHFGSRPSIYVAPNWAEQLAPLAAAGLGEWQNRQADTAEAADKKAQIEDYQRVLSGLPKTTGLRDVTTTTPGAMTPTPDAPIQQQPTSMFGTSEAAPVMPKTSLPNAMAQFTQAPDTTTTTQEPYRLTQDEYNSKLADFAGSMSPDNPMTEAIRAKVLLKTLDAPEKVYDREDRQQQARDAAELETIKQKYLQAERLGDRAEAARLQREFLDMQFQQTKEFQVAQHNDLMEQRTADRQARSDDFRYGVDNRPNPAAAKAKDANDKAETAKEHSGRLIDEMQANLDILNTGEGITNNEKSTAYNAMAWAQNTGLGQTLGKVAGTKNQTARNNISNIATNLLIDLKNAKGLSATQMNSNMELQTYLRGIAGGADFDYQSMNDVVRRSREILGASAGGGLSPDEAAELAALKAKHGR